MVANQISLRRSRGRQARKGGKGSRARRVSRRVTQARSREARQSSSILCCTRLALLRNPLHPELEARSELPFHLDPHDPGCVQRSVEVSVGSERQVFDRETAHATL